MAWDYPPPPLQCGGGGGWLIIDSPKVAAEDIDEDDVIGYRSEGMDSM